MRAGAAAPSRANGRSSRSSPIGRHPEYGRLRIDQMLHHGAEHDLIHLEQIQTTLEQLARA